MKRMMPILFFVSCCGNALCLGFLSYTFTTGELPYGLEPLYQADTSAPPPRDPEAERNEQLRAGESYAQIIYGDLQRQEEKLDARVADLDEREELLTTREDGIQELQEKVAERERKILQKLQQIDQREIANVQNMAAMFDAIDSKAAATMLLNMDDKEAEMAPRVLYYMSPDKRAQLIGAIVKQNDPAKTNRATTIMDNMRKLIPEMSTN